MLRGYCKSIMLYATAVAEKAPLHLARGIRSTEGSVVGRWFQPRASRFNCRAVAATRLPCWRLWRRVHKRNSANAERGTTCVVTACADGVLRVHLHNHLDRTVASSLIFNTASCQWSLADAGCQ